MQLVSQSVPEEKSADTGINTQDVELRFDKSNS
jgi:hypothetical protein